jgi:hypothetical protein
MRISSLAMATASSTERAPWMRNNAFATVATLSSAMKTLLGDAPGAKNVKISQHPRPRAS